jgi:hypothetical protein
MFEPWLEGKLNFRLPVAYLDNIDPSPAYVGDLIKFMCHTTDDGDIVRYVWMSKLQGRELYNGTKTSFIADNISRGYYTISLRVQDDLGAWSEPVEMNLRVMEPEDESEEGKGEFIPGFLSMSALLSMGLAGLWGKR